MELYQKPGIYKLPDDQWKCCVWAPHARKTELVLNPGSTEENVIDLTKDAAGYWKTEFRLKQNGTKYKYRINGKKLLPDPASLSQPEGVHGASAIIDLQSFNWSDQQWKNIPPDQTVMYELHTGTFTPKQNFEGITEKLDYLTDLGINAIELMPVNQFPGKRNWGYDGVYPYAVHNHYGGAEELQKLVNACHNKNIALILDVVYNHLGPEGNYLPEFAPYFTRSYNTPWGAAVNFDDVYSYGLRNYFIQNALMWLKDFHVDALRLDAVHAIKDYSAKHFLQELHEEVELLNKETGKDHYLIAESNLNDVRLINPSEKGGYGLEAQWNDDYHHALHALLTGERSGYYKDYGESCHLLKAIRDAFVYDGIYSDFRKKVYGNTAKDNPGKQFVIFNQNHDQAGNRKSGDRLTTLLNFEQLKLCTATLFSLPFVPMLFMGEEYGESSPFLYFVDHTSNELNKLVRQGRKKEFSHSWDKSPPPDPDKEETFLQSALKWNYKTNRYQSALLSLHKFLISLRKTHPVFSKPVRENLKINTCNTGNILQLERFYGNNAILGFFNYSAEREEIQLNPHYSSGLTLILNTASSEWEGNFDNIPLHPEENTTITVMPGSAIIFEGIVRKPT